MSYYFPQQLLHSRARYDRGRSFAYEDDLEFCPALVSDFGLNNGFNGANMYGNSYPYTASSTPHTSPIQAHLASMAMQQQQQQQQQQQIPLQMQHQQIQPPPHMLSQNQLQNQLPFQPMQQPLHPHQLQQQQQMSSAYHYYNNIPPLGYSPPARNSTPRAQHSTPRPKKVIEIVDPVTRIPTKPMMSGTTPSHK